MSVFQHPHLIRGIVKTSKGSFLVTRGLVEAPDDIGEALGWRPVGSDDQARPEVSKSARAGSMDPAKTDRRHDVAVHESEAESGPSRVLAGVRALLRSREAIELPDCGINLAFNAGVVAECRGCHASWPVSRTHYRKASWWSCPNGCRVHAPRVTSSTFDVSDNFVKVPDTDARAEHARR